MDYFEIVEISTRQLEITTPAAPEKILRIGQYLGLDNQKKVIDFGCGYGRLLELWSKKFGISGIGIDISQYMCNSAINRIKRAGLSDNVEIICKNAFQYPSKEKHHDIASCLRASFIWGGFRKAIKNMKDSIRLDGKLVVGEPYYIKEKVPYELVKFEGDLHTEYEMIKISREEGFDVEFVVRASRDDWDIFASSNWLGLLKWIEENPNHPEFSYVKSYFRKQQDIYFRYQSNYLGWAIYILEKSK